MSRWDQLRTLAIAFRIAPWKLALAAAGVLAATLSVALVATGLFLLLLPAALLGVGIARLLRPSSSSRMPTAARSGPTVIEVEYEVIDSGDGRRR